MFQQTINTCSTVTLVDVPSAAKTECTVLLVRDRKVVARFSVPNVPVDHSFIKLCHDPRVFVALLHKIAIQGSTKVEMLKPNDVSLNYIFRG